MIPAHTEAFSQVNNSKRPKSHGLSYINIYNNLSSICRTVYTPPYQKFRMLIPLFSLWNNPIDIIKLKREMHSLAKRNPKVLKKTLKKKKKIEA